MAHYPTVDSPDRALHRPDTLNTFGLSAAISPWPTISLEAEAFGTVSQRRSFYYDDFRFTIRYLWFDDIAGDPFSLATGFTYSRPGTRALRDIGRPYLGPNEFEGHVAIGKELSHDCCWYWRSWAVGAVTLSTRGQPRLWGNATVERALSRCAYVGLDLLGLYGFGGRPLTTHPAFNGYGPIKHRAIDIGAHINIGFPIDARLCISYCYRVWARNFPKEQHTIQFMLHWPISI